MRPMKGTIFASIPLVRISFQRWRSSYSSKYIASLACPLNRLTLLLSRLLCDDSIVIPERVAFCSRVDLYQSLAGSDNQLVVQVVFSWKTFLESGGRDSVVTSYNVGLFYFESLDIISKGFVRLLA
ncbi:unnamed protein product [Prunus armeniaca]